MLVHIQVCGYEDYTIELPEALLSKSMQMPRPKQIQRDDERSDANSKQPKDCTAKGKTLGWVGDSKQSSKATGKRSEFLCPVSKILLLY